MRSPSQSSVQSSDKKRSKSTSPVAPLRQQVTILGLRAGRDEERGRPHRS